MDFDEVSTFLEVLACDFLLPLVLIYIISKFTFQVTDLLGKHSDLMDEFNDFLERCENIGNCSSAFFLLLLLLLSIYFLLPCRCILEICFCRWVPCWCHE